MSSDRVFGLCLRTVSSDHVFGLWHWTVSSDRDFGPYLQTVSSDLNFGPCLWILMWGYGINSTKKTDIRNLVKIFVGDPRISTNPKFFGRIDLSRSLSRAKFDEEADFEVRSAVARQKPRQISKKRNFRSEIFAEKKKNRRRKTKRRESSKTRFGKVSWRSERCSRRKRSFKVCETTVVFFTTTVTRR